MPNGTTRWLGKALPIAQWLPAYGSFDLRGDAVAGLTVGVMLIPQGMAYAVIAGLPPIYGLYAALVPLMIYPVLASSRHLSVGPTAIDMLIVAAGVGAVAEVGTGQYVLLALALTALVGLAQMAMGFMRLGFLADMLSRPVVAGFTTAAAIIIGASQLGNLLGLELGRSASVYETVQVAVAQIGNAHPATCIFGIGSIALLVGLRYWKPRWPEALLVVSASILVAWGWNASLSEVAVIGAIPTGLPAPSLPTVSLGDVQTLLPTALTLALVQFMNVVSLGRTFAARHGQDLDANRELVAIGTANVCGSLFQSIPVSGSFSRTVVSDEAGGRSPLANVVAAILVMLTLLFLTPLFYYLPMPVLAAIIMVAAAGLVDLDEIRYLFHTRKREGFIALFTFATTLLLGIQTGIILGVGASLVAAFYRMSRPEMAELGHLHDTRAFHDVQRFDGAEPIDGLLILRVNAAFSFANAEHFKEFILEKSRRTGPHLQAVLIDGASINDLDTTAIEALNRIVDELEEQDIALYFSGLIGPVRDLMRRSGLYNRLGADRFGDTLHDAVTQILAARDEEDDGERLGSYLDTTAPPAAEMAHMPS